MFREMRRFKQQISREECVSILKNEKRGVLAVTGDEGWPYAVPVNFYYDEEKDKIYFHGAREGHKVDAMDKDSRVCFTVWNQGYQKEDWSYHVKSVVVFGRAQQVTDEKEIYESARALGLKYYPSAGEVDIELEKDLHRVRMTAITIEHMTGKLVHEK